MKLPRLSKPVLVMIFAGLAIILIVAGTLAQRAAASEATIRIVVAAPDDKYLSGSIDDNTEIKFSGVKADVTVKPGTHTVKVTKSGYRTFSTELTLAKDQDVTVHAVMQRFSDPVLSSLTEVEPISQVNGLNINSVTYFGAHDWALITAQDSNGNIGYFVTHYDDPSKKWLISDGPFTILPTKQTKEYPVDLRVYLRKNNLTIEDQS